MARRFPLAGILQRVTWGWACILSIGLLGCTASSDDSGSPPGLSAQQPVRVALVVGESNYPPETAMHYVGQAWPPLPVTESDATAMAAFLVRHHYQLIGNGPQMDLSHTELEDKLHELADATKQPGSVALFYISAHGMQEDGKVYVAPIDAPQPISGHPQLSTNRLSVEDIDKTVAPGSSSIFFMIFDICRDYPDPSDPISANVNNISPNSILGLATEPGGIAPAHVDGSLSDYTSAIIDLANQAGSDDKLQELLLDASLTVEEGANDAQIPLYQFGQNQVLENLSVGYVFGDEPSFRHLQSKNDFSENSNMDALSYVDPKNLYCRETLEYPNPVPGSDEYKDQEHLLAGSDRDAKQAFCTQLEKRMRAEGLDPNVSNRYSNQIKARIKQIAAEGNRRALFLLFLFQGKLPNIFGFSDDCNPEVDSNDRSYLEYLATAAAEGDPEAEYIYGRRLMPAWEGNPPCSTLPGNVQQNFDLGTQYLEKALDADIADAGYVLASVNRENLPGLSMHKDKVRQYAEQALHSDLLWMDNSDTLTTEIELGEDYMLAETGPIDLDKALALLNDAYDYSLDHDQKRGDHSAHGEVAWAKAYVLTKKYGDHLDQPTIKEINGLFREAERLGAVKTSPADPSVCGFARGDGRRCFTDRVQLGASSN